MPTTILTFGHGSASQDDLVRLVEGAGITAVVDVRRFPGSRRHPHVAREELASWLPDAGVDYRWEPRLGGRRRLDRGDESDAWWQVDAFRAYAAYTRTQEFGAGLADLLDGARARPDGTVTIMCSESLWWRCHRRIVADVLTLLHGVEVEHLGHDGRRTPHVPAPGARPSDDGLRYPAEPPSPQ